MTTVVIADDHPLVRHGLRAVLDAAAIDVVGEAADGVEAVELVTRTAPDVVLMDLQLPRLNGIDATRQITAHSPSTAVLALTMYDDDDTVFAAIQAGAAGYLVKGAEGPQIISAVRAAAAGQSVFGAALSGRLAEWLSTRRQPRSSPFPQLTERELEILDLIAAGNTNGAIGAALHLSAKTVANNVSTILNKLHLHDRSQAIVHARDAGLGQRPRTR